MAARSTWSGAVEFKVSGMPVPIGLSFYNRHQSPPKSEGFRMVDAKGYPVSQKWETHDGKIVDRSATLKGIEVAKGQPCKVVDPETIALLEADRTQLAEPDSFAPLSSIDLTLAKATYYVTPDASQPGSEKSAQVRCNDLAYVTRITFRGNSPDTLIVIYGAEDGLRAASMPFAGTTNEPPPCGWEPDENVGKVFAAAVAQSYEVANFDPAEHPSEFKARRAKVVEAILADEAPAVEAPAPQKSTEPDLMALLTASVEMAGKS
jgi:non-homologous end joining protein Ku